MDDYGDDYGNNDDADFQMEAKAYERAGPSGKLDELLSKNYDKKKGGRDIHSQIDRFLINVDATSRMLNEEGLLSISQADIDTMLEKTVDIPNAKYKNPLAYILSYEITKGGTSFEKKDFDSMVKKVLKEVGKERGVEPEDLVRYCRFWTIYV